MLQFDAQVGRWQRVAAGRRPLDERDRVRPEVVVPGEQLRVGAAAEPVQVEVVQHLAVAPVVALRQREGRAGDGAAHAAGAQRRADERRLAGAQVALDGDERRRTQLCGQRTRELPRLGRRGEGERDHLEEAELLRFGRCAGLGCGRALRRRLVGDGDRVGGRWVGGGRCRRRLVGDGWVGGRRFGAD